MNSVNYNFYDFAFPIPRTNLQFPAFEPASQSLQVVGTGDNTRVYNANGVEATTLQFRIPGPQNSAYGTGECRDGNFQLSARSTVVAGEQQVRIVCGMQWRRLADIPPLSPTPLDDSLATSQNDHCIISQWPSNDPFAADSNDQYCNDLLGGIVTNFEEIGDRLTDRVSEYNAVLSPAAPAQPLFSTPNAGVVRGFPYFFANNRMFNDRGVEINETTFNIADPVAAAFNQNRLQCRRFDFDFPKRCCRRSAESALGLRRSLGDGRRAPARQRTARAAHNRLHQRRLVRDSANSRPHRLASAVQPGAMRRRVCGGGQFGGCVSGA